MYNLGRTSLKMRNLLSTCNLQQRLNHKISSPQATPSSYVEKAPQAETNQTSEYFIEFMKLLKAQKEIPFLYTSKDFKEEHIDLSFLQSILPIFSNQPKSFVNIGVNKRLVDALLIQNIKSPLTVQTTAIPKLLKGKRAIIESATGSGKTLTYLLPIVQNIGSNSCANVIIVPTRELASQVYKEALKYVSDKSLVSRHVSGVNIEHEKKLSHALKDSKILIGTPKKLLDIVEGNLGYFRKVKCVVVDEVDKLLPFKTFHTKHQKMRATKTKPTEKLLSIFTYYQKSIQLIATSATISKTLIQELQDLGFQKDCEVITLIPNDFKHGKVPENIKHVFTVIKDEEEFCKIKFIARLFKHSKEKSILVFIDRGDSVERTVDEFKNMGFNSTALYKELLLPAPGSFDNFLKSFEKGDIEFVVATEETVRGMDFPFVNQVYLTYIPDSAESYVHVAGRVGRLDRPGVVTTVLGGANEKIEKKKMRRIFTALSIKGRLLKH